MKWSEVKWLSRVRLCDPMDCTLPGSSVDGIFQAIVLEWIAIFFSRGSSQPRDWTQVSCIVDRCFAIWATREVLKEGIVQVTILNIGLYEKWSWLNHFKAIALYLTLQCHYKWHMQREYRVYSGWPYDTVTCIHFVIRIEWLSWFLRQMGSKWGRSTKSSHYLRSYFMGWLERR